MGSLREIVEAAAVERLFLLLAIIGPLVGLLIGGVIGKRQHNPRGPLVGLLLGLLGALNWLLWRVYNALTDRNGLDTVRNVVVNFALFVAVGAIIGVVAGRFLARRNPPEQDGSQI